MKIDEKEKLIIFILSVVAIVAFFVMFLAPSMLNNRKALQEENVNLEKRIDEVRKMNNLIMDYKVLNMKVGAFLKGYFQDLNQEKIIIVIDDLLKTAGLESMAITFNEAAAEAAAEEAAEEESKNQILKNYPYMFADIDYIGNVGGFLKYLEEVGKFNKKILVRELNMNVENNNVDALTGKIGLQFLAINGTREENTALTSLPTNGGKSNPFSSHSVVEPIPNVDVAKLLLEQIKGGNSDFTLMAKPIDSSLPTVVLGLENDVKAASYVYANNPEVENVGLRLFKNEEGQYFYKYHTEERSYPFNEEGKAIPFVTGNNRIVLKIYSDLRKDAYDISGVRLSLYNETDLPLVVELRTEDAERPRLEFAEREGIISIYDAQGQLINTGVKKEETVF